MKNTVKMTNTFFKQTKIYFQDDKKILKIISKTTNTFFRKKIFPKDETNQFKKMPY